jgi:hypothetical protein
MNIVAYGSLMKQSGLESVLRRSAPLSKITITGWKRIFNAPFDDYAFLNLQRAPGVEIEAAYFELEPAELELFAEREAGAELVEVKAGFFAFVWPQDYCRDLPTLRSYIHVCSDGANELGIDFMVGMDWPQTVVDDAHDPIYR